MVIDIYRKMQELFGINSEEFLLCFVSSFVLLILIGFLSYYAKEEKEQENGK